MNHYEVDERVEAEILEGHWVSARVTDEGENWVEVEIDSSALNPQQGITSRKHALAKACVRRQTSTLH